eukprot:scaffold926_cov408-Prasinococcus_capsulatus_cf.AAC.13
MRTADGRGLVHEEAATGPGSRCSPAVINPNPRHSAAPAPVRCLGAWSGVPPLAKESYRRGLPSPPTAVRAGAVKALLSCTAANKYTWADPPERLAPRLAQPAALRRTAPPPRASRDGEATCAATTHNASSSSSGGSSS